MHYYCQFTNNEIACEIKRMNLGKGPSFNDIHPEFLIHCGKCATQWLAHFYTDVLQSGQIFYKLKLAKIVAILKTGKPNSHHPIVLLSMMYKLLKVLIYHLNSSIILDEIPIGGISTR